MAISIATAITNLLPALNADALANLIWWTETELYEFAEEAARRLARSAAVFVETEQIAVSGGTASYTLGARSIATVHVSLGNTRLRPASVRELEALDTGWEATTGTPKRWTHALGIDSIRIYPEPTAGGTLEVVHHQHPPEITSAAPTVAAPAPLAGYFGQAILAAARAKEGDAAMPEVAAHARERLALYERVCQAYWGGGA